MAKVTNEVVDVAVETKVVEETKPSTTKELHCILVSDGVYRYEDADGNPVS